MNAIVESKTADIVPENTEVPAGVSPLVAMLASGQLQAEHVAQAMQLQKDHDEYEAKKAYSVALAKFRKMAPTLKQNKLVDFATQKGRTTYTHTSLGYALTEVNPLLGDCDLNISWHPRQADGLVYVVTRLTHISGHSDEVELQAQPDNSGNKNPIQAVKSAITYLKREGALSILGLASEEDDDGHTAFPKADQKPSVEMLDEDDMKEIEALCTECGKDYTKFLEYASTRMPLFDGVLQGPKSKMAQMVAHIRKSAKPEGGK